MNKDILHQQNIEDDIQENVDIDQDLSIPDNEDLDLTHSVLRKNNRRRNIID